MTERRRPPRVGAPVEVAAGATSVANAVRHAVGKVGAVRGPATLLKANQRDGFDCPGCAWPDADGRRSRAEFCENGAKAIADEATRERVTADFFRRWPVIELRERSGRWLNARGRLTEPVVLRPGAERYEPVSWDEALALIATELRALDDPDEAVFYTSGRTSNEAAFLWQLFARRLGTNNLPDCSNLCHESSGWALTDSIGVGKGTVTLQDFEHADAIFVVGQNPGSNHPRMLATLQQAKRRGAVVVSINPLQETGLRRFRNPQEVAGYLGAGTPLADLHLPVRVGGDAALLKGIARALFEEERRRPGEIVDSEFVARHTEGFEAFRRDAEAADWADIERVSGVPAELIRRAAAVAAGARAAIWCWAMGVTQHRNAVANVQQIVNLLLMRGHLGRPGAGACPVRGHSNVQGDRTMGIWERPTAAFLAALRDEFGFEPPPAHGHDTVNALRAMAAGKVRVFMAMGGNFLGATPDWDYGAAAAARCRLTVQVSTKLNRSHLYTGRTALILPALGRTERDLQAGVEQGITVENSMGVVRLSRGTLAPAAATLRSEVRIVADLASATFGEDAQVDWQGLAADYRRIRDHVARVVPGFADFNARLERDGEFLLPNPVRDRRQFPTPTGRARFTVHELGELAVPDGHFLMTTIRSHDQFNTTVYSDDDRYRGISGSRRVVLMNEADMAGAGLRAGMAVDVHSGAGDAGRVLRAFHLVPYDIPHGCVATYYPEANPLIPVDHVAAFSNTPAYKSVVVRVEPHAGGAD